MSTSFINLVLNDKSSPVALLELSQGYNACDVRRSYRKKALLVHPDRNKNEPKAAAAFDRLKDAQDFLIHQLGESVNYIDNNYYYQRNNNSDKTRDKTDSSTKNFDQAHTPFSIMIEKIKNTCFSSNQKPPSLNELNPVYEFIRQFPEAINQKLFDGGSLFYAIMYKIHLKEYSAYKEIAELLITLSADPFIGEDINKSAIHYMIELEMWDLIEQYALRRNLHAHEVICQFIEQTDSALLAQPILSRFMTNAHPSALIQIKSAMIEKAFFIPVLEKNGLLLESEAHLLLQKKIVGYPELYYNLPESYREMPIYIVAFLAQVKVPNANINITSSIPHQKLSPNFIKALVYLYPWLNHDKTFEKYKLWKNRLQDNLILEHIMIPLTLTTFFVSTEPSGDLSAAMGIYLAGIIATALIYVAILGMAVLADYISFKTNPEAQRINDIIKQHRFFNEPNTSTADDEPSNMQYEPDKQYEPTFSY